MRPRREEPETAQRLVRFFVSGIPAPQGSMKITGKRTGFARMVHASEQTIPWRESVRAAAALAWPEPPTDYAARLELVFQFAPLSAKARRDPDAPHAVKPDLDKLIRAVCDALTGIVYTTDSRVCQIAAIKRYDARPGVEVTIDTEVVATPPADKSPSEVPNRQPSPAPEPGGGRPPGVKGRRKGRGQTDFAFGGGASRGEAVNAK